MSTIGQTLRESREKQKISLDVAAKAVKVKNEVLDNVEKDDFSKFAASIYARGIIRLYATFLGLEPESLVEEYNKLHPPQKNGNSQSPAAEGERAQIERRRAMVISTVSKPSDLSPRGVAGLIAVAIFLGVAIWVLSTSREAQPEPSRPIAPRMTETDRKPVPAPSPAPQVPSTGPQAILPSGATNTPTNSMDVAVPALELEPGANQ